MKLSRASPKSGSKTALDDASEHPEVGCVEGGMLIADAVDVGVVVAIGVAIGVVMARCYLWSHLYFVPLHYHQRHQRRDINRIISYRIISY